MTRRSWIPQLIAASALIAGAVLLVAANPLGANGSGTWETLADADVRQEVSYVRVGTKLYLAGGASTQRSYDTASNSWNDPDTDPLPSPGNLDHIQGAAVGGKIYYIGGLDKDSPQGYPFGEVGSVQIFDPATGNMTAGAPMPAGRARGAGAVAVFDGLIYYFGGLGGGTAKRWVDAYDPVEDEWTSLPDMPNSRDHAVAVPFGGLIHLIGGRAGTDFNTTTGSHRTYNPATGQWVTSGIAPLQTARGGHAAALLGSEIVVLGGEGPPVSPPSPAIARVEAYNPATNSWRDLTPMTTPRHGIQAAVCSGSIYVAGGGVTATYDPTDAHERFSLGAAGQCTNATPVCAASSLATAPGTPVTASLNCTDADQDAIAYSIVSFPQYGTLDGPDAAGRFTYSPDPGYQGEDAFSVRATDGVLSPPATIRIDVGPVSALQVAPTSLDFGLLDIGSGPSSPQTLTIANTSSGPLSVTGAGLGGVDADQFAVVANGCQEVSLGSGQECDLALTFDPAAVGSKTAAISISSSAPGSPHSATLTGTGTASSTGPPEAVPGRCANVRRGSPQPDTITGTRFGDAIAGLGGNDTLRGAGAVDCLNGGSGDDGLAGGTGADTLRGGLGRDVLRGRAGADTIFAGSGANKAWGGSGDDLIRVTNDRHDFVDCGPGRDVARADPADQLLNCERIRRG